MAQQYVLIINRDKDNERSYKIKTSGLTIGRFPDVDIILQDQLVSRRHARLFFDGEVLRVEDMDSRNGILVNGEARKQAALDQGDRIDVGASTFYVEKLVEFSSESSSAISFEKAQQVYDNILHEAGTGRLPVLYEAAQLLGTVFDLDELLAKILNIIFKAIPAKRGFVLTLSEQTNEPEVRATFFREEEEGGPPLSTTLVDYVFTHHTAILTQDAQSDSRFNAAASIVTHTITTAMCVPLSGRQPVVGLIYLDSGKTAAEFTNDDLELVTAIGRVVGIAVENARLYKENLQQERLAAIGQATASLGHCIKNIMTGLKGGAEYVDSAMVDSDWKRLKKGWPIVRRAVSRIETLALDMLAMSRDRTPEKIPTDINGLVRDLMESMQQRSEKLNIELEFKPGELSVVRADGRDIYHAILNLVTNAMDACAENKGGKIKTATWAEGDFCYIEVADTGPGIPSEHLPKLSEAFFSTKGSTGTGLGLSCCYKIVKEHGGKVICETEVGKGTTFTVKLPINYKKTE